MAHHEYENLEASNNADVVKFCGLTPKNQCIRSKRFWNGVLGGCIIFVLIILLLVLIFMHSFLICFWNHNPGIIPCDEPGAKVPGLVAIFLDVILCLFACFGVCLYIDENKEKVKKNKVVRILRNFCCVEQVPLE